MKIRILLLYYCFNIIWAFLLKFIYIYCRHWTKVDYLQVYPNIYMDISTWSNFLLVVTNFEGIKLYDMVCLMVFNATFNNIS